MCLFRRVSTIELAGYLEYEPIGYRRMGTYPEGILGMVRYAHTYQQCVHTYEMFMALEAAT